MISKQSCARAELFFIAIWCTLFLSCAKQGRDEILHLAFQTEPSTLDPAFSVDVSSGIACSLVHSTLVAFDKDANIVPCLARSWEIDEGDCNYIFHLAEQRFSNGRRVTAEDVVYSFKRLLDSTTASPRWWLLKSVRGAANFHAGGPWDKKAIEAVDDSTVAIRLEKPIPHFLSLLAMPSAGIVAPEEVERMGTLYGRKPCGSGPWKLLFWHEGDELSFAANEGWNGGKQAIAGLSYRILPEPMTQIAEFEVGSLDIIEVPGSELEHWRSAGAKLLSREELRVVYIGLNTRKAPLDDPRVRKALNHAIDVEKIIVRVLFGAAKPARGTVPPGLRKWEEQTELYPYDPQRARALLAEAGLEGGFSLEIWQRENPEAQRILEAVQGYLSEVGVRAEIVTREWSAFKEAIDRGVPDAFFIDWIADYPDAENFLSPLFHSSNTAGGGNRTGYSNPLVDSLIDVSAVMLEDTSRWRCQRDIEAIVYDDAPWIFLWFPERFELVSDRLEGYEIPLIFNGQRFLSLRLEREGR